MNQGKIIAVITGAISILLAIAYLVLVQLLDIRGEMIPAPTSEPLSLNASPPHWVNNCNSLAPSSRIV